MNPLKSFLLQKNISYKYIIAISFAFLFFSFAVVNSFVSQTTVNLMQENIEIQTNNNQQETTNNNVNLIKANQNPLQINNQPGNAATTDLSKFLAAVNTRPNSNSPISNLLVPTTTRTDATNQTPVIETAIGKRVSTSATSSFVYPTYPEQKSNLTVYKEDTEGQRLPNWEFILTRGGENLNTINVSNNKGTTTSRDFQEGNYTINVSGLYNYGPNVNDAGYSKRNETTFGSEYIVNPGNWLDSYRYVAKNVGAIDLSLRINDICAQSSNNSDAQTCFLANPTSGLVYWGAFNNSNEYTINYTHNGGPITFSIRDNTYSDNNAGSLKAEIKADFATGFTDANGQIVFNLKIGEYYITETIKPGSEFRSRSDERSNGDFTSINDNTITFTNKLTPVSSSSSSSSSTTTSSSTSSTSSISSSSSSSTTSSNSSSSTSTSSSSSVPSSSSSSNISSSSSSVSSSSSLSSSSTTTSSSSTSTSSSFSSSSQSTTSSSSSAVTVISSSSSLPRSSTSSRSSAVVRNQNIAAIPTVQNVVATSSVSSSSSSIESSSSNSSVLSSTASSSSILGQVAGVSETVNNVCEDKGFPWWSVWLLVVSTIFTAVFALSPTNKQDKEDDQN